MKLFIFLVVIGSFTVEVFGLDNYNDIANALRTKVEGLIKSLGATRDNLESQFPKISTMDFNIRNEKSIAPVQKALDQKAGKNGVDRCKSAFEDALGTILEDVRHLAVKSITDMRDRIDASNAELQNVLKNLQAPALAQELEKCKAPTTCNLTGSYAKSANNADAANNDINKNLLSPTYNLRLSQQILSDIDNDIVKKTNACLAPL